MKGIKFRNTIIQYRVNSERTEIEFLNTTQEIIDGYLVIDGVCLNHIRFNNYFFKRLLKREGLKFKVSKLHAYKNENNNYYIYFWK